MPHALIAFAAAAAAAASHAHAAGPLQFDGVALGASLESWKARPFADREHPGARPVCAASGRAVVCRSVGVYGHASVPEGQPLVGGYVARAPVYRFVDGRLVQISFTTSTDAFNQLVAWLKTRYGAPTQIVHDTAAFGAVRLPQVKMRWRLPQGQIAMTDPIDVDDQLSVTLSAPGAAAGKTL